MCVTAEDYRDAARHEVPHCYSTIIATHRQIVAPTVERTSECFASRVKVAVIVLKEWSHVMKFLVFDRAYLGIVLTKGF